MKATDLLLNRQSNGVLTAPGPNEGELDFILQAGMRVPDHAGLTPWRFSLARNQGLKTLSDIFVSAVNGTVDDAKLDKIRNMPFRAPLIIVVTTNYQLHDKVPQKEQTMAAGCAVQAMQMAAYALGYGAIWRTGELTENSAVKEKMGVSEDNDIVGFLYIGSNKLTPKVKPRKHYNDVTTEL